MIHTIRTVAVGDQESKIDSPIILYRGDREVEVEFTINGSKFTFTNGGNVIKSTNATHGQLVINTPTGENMFSEVTECHDGKVVFVVTKEMIDELIEVGFYSFQIRLFDESQVSRVTIPPVLKGIDIRNPIAAEDETNVVDIGLVDYAVVVKDKFEDLSTFLPDGNYNKTEWESKDVISKAKLNKIEDALYNINSNMEATDLALLNRIEYINRNVYVEIDKLEKELESEVEEFERDLNNNVEMFKVDLEYTMESYIKQKPYFFETVSDMLRSDAINNGDICRTLGYYTVGDGGGALYNITAAPSSEDGFSFLLSNGMTAELVFDDEINIRQLGARDFDENGIRVDIAPFINLYISKTNPIGNPSNSKIIKLYIPPGRWFSSPLKIKSSSIYIYGVNGYSYPYATGTVILPIENNQPYVWVLGDDTADTLGREYGNINLRNITFSTHNHTRNGSVYVGGMTSESSLICEKLLVISRCYGGIIDNVHFTNYIGTPLSINSSNEMIFNDITFRNGDAFNTGNLVFDVDITGQKNISACFFDKLSFEGVKGDLITFKSDSKFINNHIGTVIFEDRSTKISKDGVFRNYSASSDEQTTFTSKSIFNIEEQEYCEVNVDNVLLNNFCRSIFTIDEKEYLFDTVVKINGKISKGHANIKNVTNVGTRRDIMLFNVSNYEHLGSYNFKLTCMNANIIDSNTYRFTINTKGCTRPNINYKESGYKRCIDYVISPSTLLNKNGKAGYYMPVVSDKESLTDEKLVIDNFNYTYYLSSYTSEPACFMTPVMGNKLHIRANTKTGFVAQCYVTKNENYQNHTVKNVIEGYNWYVVDFTEYRNANPDEEMTLIIRTLSDDGNYVKLDVFYWE